MADSYQAVRTHDDVSGFSRLTSRMPQRSILGPVLLIVYTSSLSDALKHCGRQFYAENSQINYSSTLADQLLVLKKKWFRKTTCCISATLSFFECRKVSSHKISKSRVANLYIKISDSKLSVLETQEVLAFIWTTRAYCNLKQIYHNRHLFDIRTKFNFYNAIYRPCVNYLNKNEFD